MRGDGTLEPRRQVGAATAALLALALSIPSPADTETSIDYREFMRWTGARVAMPDTARSIASGPGVAFVAADAAGLVVVDTADPNDPFVLATLPLPGITSARSVDYRDGFAYVALEQDGLVTVDVSNPSAPVVVSQQILDGRVRGVSVINARLMVALTSLTPDGRIITFELVSSPAFPGEIGRTVTPRRAFEVLAVPRTAYVADNLCQEVVGCTGGFGVYTILDGNPVEEGYRSTGPFDSMAIAGGYAHLVSSSNFGYRIYDARNPSAIQLVGSIPSLRPRDVTLDQTRQLAFLTGGGIDVVDISNLASPRLVGAIASPPNVPANHLFYHYKCSFLSDGLFLNVIDTGAPGPAPLVGGVDTPGFAYDVGVSGSRAAVADGTALRVYDLSVPQLPLDAGTVGGAFVTVATHDDLAYAHAAGQLTVIDLSTSPPSALAKISAPGSPLSVDLTDDGSYLIASYFRATASEGVVRVFDVRDPSAPTLVRGVETGTTNEAVEVHAAGTSLYVSLVQLLEYDITDPESPAIRRVYQAQGAIVGFTTDGAHGFAVSNTSTRSFITAYALGTTSPIGSLEVGGPLEAITVLDGVAYVASAESGVNVIDVSDPMDMQILGNVDTPGDARHIVPVADVALAVADGASGLRVAARQQAETTVAVDPAAPAAVTGLLAPVTPNPMRGSARVTFELEQDGAVDLQVFDVHGRRVRELAAARTFGAGRHSVGWDARDDAGRVVAPGTYLVRMRADGRADTRRVVVLR